VSKASAMVMLFAAAATAQCKQHLQWILKPSQSHDAGKMEVPGGKTM